MAWLQGIKTMRDDAKEIDLALAEISRVARTLPRHLQLSTLARAYSQCLIESSLHLTTGQTILEEAFRKELGITRGGGGGGKSR